MTRHPHHGQSDENIDVGYTITSPGQHAEPGDRGIAWRTTADGTREQAGHALLRDRRLRPDRHPRLDRAHGRGVSTALSSNEERASGGNDIHSMQRETESSANGIAVEIEHEIHYSKGHERDQDGRAACRGLREHLHHEHLHEHTWQSDFPDGERETGEQAKAEATEQT